MQSDPSNPQEAPRAYQNRTKPRSRQAETAQSRLRRGREGNVVPAADGERPKRGAAADFTLPTAHSKRAAQRQHFVVGTITIGQKKHGMARTAAWSSDFAGTQEYILLRIGVEQ